MTVTALAAFDGDDEPQPLPVVPSVDAAELDELWRALDRWLLWAWYREGEL